MESKISVERWVFAAATLLAALVLFAGSVFYPNGMPLWMRLLHISILFVVPAAAIAGVVRKRKLARRDAAR
jgi:ABC-type multidrug transport system permease subunit